LSIVGRTGAGGRGGGLDRGGLDGSGACIGVAAATCFFVGFGGFAEATARLTVAVAAAFDEGFLFLGAMTL